MDCTNGSRPRRSRSSSSTSLLCGTLAPMPGQSAKPDGTAATVRQRLEAVGILVEQPNAKREYYNLERASTRGNPEGTSLGKSEKGWHFVLLDAVPGPSGEDFEVL